MEYDLSKVFSLTQTKNNFYHIIKCNNFTQQFGFSLSNEEALQLLNNRKNILKEQERLELGESILPKLIFAFCDSPYIHQSNYVETLDALQSMFYLYKNESLDILTDEELITFMKEHFDGDCQGSLEYLEDTVLDAFCRHLREDSTTINKLYGRNNDDK